MGGAGGSVGAWQNSKLNVDFHETGFLGYVKQENQLTLQKGFWFQLSGQDAQKADPSGPNNPQALNRYSYVLGNPLRYIDPTGHFIVRRAEAATAAHNLKKLRGQWKDILADAQKRDQTAVAVFNLEPTGIAETIISLLAIYGQGDVADAQEMIDFLDWIIDLLDWLAEYRPGATDNDYIDFSLTFDFIGEDYGFLGMGPTTYLYRYWAQADVHGAGSEKLMERRYRKPLSNKLLRALRGSVDNSCPGSPFPNWPERAPVV